MNISRNQMIMLSIGGVSLVASAVLGYLAFSAYSAKTEASEASAGDSSAIRALLGAAISPDAASVAAVNNNRDALAGWTEAAISTASAGDCAISADVNEAAFKQKLVDDARVLSELPGGVGGKIVKPDFPFGFPDFVTGDKLPEKERLPQLQRQWFDIRKIVETLQSCGIVELVRIEPTLVKQPAVAEQQPKETKRRNRRRKADEEAKPAYTEERYAVDFRAKPAALVKAVNALATCERFIVVETLDFAREGDMIGKALGEGDKKGAAAEQQVSRPRRRRRGAAETGFEAQAAAQDAAPAVDDGVVNDPAKEEPFLVRMIVATYDFGSAAKQAEGGSAAPAADDGREEKEGEE